MKQNPALAAALIAAISALFGGLVAAGAKFIFDFYLSERIRRRWNTIDIKRQYSAQIIRSADELAGRIENMDRLISEGSITQWLKPLAEKDRPDVPFKRYYFISTIFLFCRLVAWIEVLKREQIFLDLASTKETRKFNSHLTLLYSIISFAHLTGNVHERESLNHWIYFHLLPGIGEALFSREAKSEKLRCLTFEEFCARYRNVDDHIFQSWMSEVERLFCDLSASDKDVRWHRVQMLWFCLDQFLEFADPQRLRTTRNRNTSRKIDHDLRKTVIAQAKLYRLKVR